MISNIVRAGLEGGMPYFEPLVTFDLGVIIESYDGDPA
jgi:hypothetical protein